MCDGKCSLHLSKKEDASYIANLHSTYISEGFLSKLGNSFLKLLYSFMAESDFAFCVVARKQDKIIGFVSASTDIGKFYKEFLLRRGIIAFFILMPGVLRLTILKKLMESLLYPINKPKNLPSAELLSIVIDKQHQGTDAAKMLFDKMADEYRKRGIKRFKVVVGADLKRAIKFYEKMGGTLFREIEIHKGEKSFVYVWDLSH